MNMKHIVFVLALTTGKCIACPGNNGAFLTSRQLAQAHGNLKGGVAVAVPAGPLLGVCSKQPESSIADDQERSACSAYHETKESVRALFASYDVFQKTALQGIVLRAGFHDPGEFDPDAADGFGPDGCFSQTADNLGLFESTSLIRTVVAPLWQNVCDRVSAADFIPLISKAVVELSLYDEEDEEKAAEINIPLYVGRKTNENCDLIVDRLPAAQPGFFTFHPFFVKKMGLSVLEGGTLLGGHTLGHVHCNVSGYCLDKSSMHYDGKDCSIDPSKDVQINAFDQTPAKFDNDYFISSFQHEWEVFTQLKNPKQSHWEFDESPAVILNSDMNMQWNIDLTAPPLKSKSQQSNIKQECEPGGFENEIFVEDEEESSDDKFGCSTSANKKGKQVTFLSGSEQEKFLLEMQLAAMVQSFANNQTLFFSKFGSAFGKIGRVGYAIEGQVGDKESKFTRLGMLKEVDLSSCVL